MEIRRPPVGTFDGRLRGDFHGRRHVGHPDVIATEQLPAEIDTTQGPARGRAVVVQLRRTGKPAHVHVAVDVDAAGFIDLLTERIGSLGWCSAGELRAGGLLLRRGAGDQQADALGVGGGAAAAEGGGDAQGRSDAALALLLGVAHEGAGERGA